MKNKPIPVVERAHYLRDICRGREVLHLGCTNWPYREQSAGDDRFIHFALAETARDLWGIDGDQEGIDALAAQGVRQLLRGDLERLDEVPLDRTFDVVVAGEIIEHLSNPGLFLRSVRRFMRPDTVLVITTVNAYCILRLAAYTVLGRGGINEPVHPDHVAYYSYATLRKLIEKNELVPGRFFFYDIGHEHRPFVSWRLKMINDVAVKISPQLAPGVILECSLT